MFRGLFAFVNLEGIARNTSTNFDVAHRSLSLRESALFRGAKGYYGLRLLNGFLLKSFSLRSFAMSLVLT